MKLTIPRSELKGAVAGLSKIISNKTTLPILGHVKFEVQGRNVTVHGSDLDQQATYAFADAVCDGQGGFTAGFHQLKDLSKGPDADKIEFMTAGKDRLTVVNPVAGQSVRLDVPALDPAEWPVMAAEVKTAPVDDFLATFQRLVPFASTDDTRYVINSCFLDLTEKGTGKSCMVSTDGRRLTVYNSMTLPLDKGAIVPTTKFLSWLKGDCQIGAVEKNGVQWFAVETGPWSYLTKAIAGTYPNYRQVLPSDPGNNKITFADDIAPLKQILKALPDVSGQGGIVLSGGPAGILTVCAEGGDKKIVCINVPGASYTGECEQYALDRNYLAEALEAGFRTFTFVDEFCPTVSDDGRGGRHVIMPMRLNIMVPAVEAHSTDVKAETAVVAVQKADVPVITATPAGAVKVVEPVVTTGAVELNVRHEHSKPKQKGDKMSKQENTAIEKLQAAYEQAKDKVKEASAALTDLAGLIKDALKEEKQRRAEIDNVRATVAKIQSIKV